ncbi:MULTISPECIES: tRNA (guanosine(37)-N1)-methyltransferase TrmD [Candidatus Ichthyocystis]|uniref:tRNA (guanine-N(1)-)-methyltransferase n=2 Tax=Candidatus Ichthyocystis hellenicum TaxID=1561003 RepID=A0A0S4LZ92_9BURK|nr:MULTISPECIES: tRNA (guanosine(37)-N1)-methyltransferase TrmD [Ichthyocystis]CUT16887.1 tRNA (guanine-N(1)-)-methyltransferase [Candidatus Ichthyocystis hellenicum]
MGSDDFVPHYRIVTVFPEMFSALSEYGVTGRACKSGICQVSLYNLRDYGKEPRRRVDDRPFGGGAGMVLMPEPLSLALRAACSDAGSCDVPVVYMSPQGKVLDQDLCLHLSGMSSIVFVCGRYEGVDQRIIDNYVTDEVSIGDYILTGGDLAAMVVLDAVIRLLPGSVGDPDSVRHESFSGGLLDWPQYTRPVAFDGVSVPEVLLSGNHSSIARWRLKQSLGRTWLKRPDLIRCRGLSEYEEKLLGEFLFESSRQV